MADQPYQHIFEHTPAGIAIHEPGTVRLQRVNGAYASAFGTEPAAVHGKTLADLVEEDQSTLSTVLESVLDGTEAEMTRTFSVEHGGGKRTVTLVFTAITVGDRPQLMSTIDSVRDDADDSTTSASARRLQVALTGTNTGVWEWHLDTDELIWTESMKQLFGVESGAFAGTLEGFTDRVHPDDLPHVQSALETAVEQNGLFQSESRILRDDGDQRWVYARGELHETPGEPRRMVGIVTDITERKLNEQALHRQESQYKQLVERLPQAHYTVDDEWRITFCNEALADRLGMSSEEVQGQLLWDVFPEGEGSIIEQTFQRVMETNEAESFEYEDGNRIVSIQAYPYHDGVAAVSTDISSQREALLSVLDATPVILYRFDDEGIFQEMRGKMLSELGLDPDDLIGESVFDVYADYPEVVEAARRALDGESFRYTVTLGDVTLETNFTPVYEDGEVIGVIGVSMNVSELQRQRERMEFFNSILRHDVLNGMTVIKMRAEILAAELDGEHQQYAQTIVDWCDTTTDVTNRVRRVIQTLTTPDEEHSLEAVDVSTILERKHKELSNAYPSIDFSMTAPEDVLVTADELLADVLGNLLTNSIEHNDTDGLRIETTVECDGDTARIRVADNGTGIADERRESVFRRGETSHAKETGSGFGLFFVDVMIGKYGGSIRVEDSESGGACFVIELDLEEP